MHTKIRFLFPMIAVVVLAGCGFATVSTTAATPGSTSAAGQTATVSEGVAPNLTGAAASLEADLETIYQSVSPSVVRIQVVENSAGRISTGASLVSGSGFVWDTSGHIVTNNHVVANAATVTVFFPDGTELPAKVTGTDPGADLAVIQVSTDSSLLKPVTMGDSNSVKVGQLAIVIGYPFALDSTMTYGIISGMSRLLPVSSSGGAYSIPDVIQTDAPINPGNSGGVLVDATGLVVGVPSANISSSGESAGIGFAIPSNIVSMEVPVLISSGSYPHAYLGISAGTLTSEIAQAMGLDPSTRGVLIVDVQAGGPAAKAGLRGSTKTVNIGGTPTPIGGDIITGADGKTIKEFEDLTAYTFLNKKIGDTMQVTYLRDGKSQTTTVTFTALT
jgi:serine protease Do